MNGSRRKRWAAVAVAALLGGCGQRPPAEDGLDAAEAARWLQRACGITPAEPLLLRQGRHLHAPGGNRWQDDVEARVLLLEPDVATVLEALRHSPRLNLRGASATRWSFQTPPGRAQEAECELDTGTRVLYFRYVE